MSEQNYRPLQIQQRVHYAVTDILSALTTLVQCIVFPRGNLAEIFDGISIRVDPSCCVHWVVTRVQLSFSFAGFILPRCVRVPVLNSHPWIHNVHSNLSQMQGFGHILIVWSFVVAGVMCIFFGFPLISGFDWHSDVQLDLQYTYWY